VDDYEPVIRLHVHYSQAYVFSKEEAEDTGDLDAFFKGQSNGLMGARKPGMLFLTTGLHTGHVNFMAEVLEAEPPQDDAWEECVEASFRPGSSETQVVDWDGNSVCVLPLEMSDYRVRYNARAMDEAREQDTVLADEDPIDSYRLLFWPAPPEPDRIVKQTSETARYWHDWAQSL
jgi:hypothetical protein